MCNPHVRTILGMVQQKIPNFLSCATFCRICFWLEHLDSLLAFLLFWLGAEHFRSPSPTFCLAPNSAAFAFWLENCFRPIYYSGFPHKFFNGRCMELVFIPIFHCHIFIGHNAHGAGLCTRPVVASDGQHSHPHRPQRPQGRSMHSASSRTDGQHNHPHQHPTLGQ